MPLNPREAQEMAEGREPERHNEGGGGYVLSHFPWIIWLAFCEDLVSIRILTNACRLYLKHRIASKRFFY